MSEKEGRIRVPQNAYDILEWLAKREGKTVDNYVADALRTELLESDRLLEHCKQTHEEAKKAGLTTTKYLDQVLDKMHKELFGS